MILFLARDHREAEHHAKQQGLSRGEWRYVTGPDSLVGISIRADQVRVVGTFWRRPDAPQLMAEVRMRLEPGEVLPRSESLTVDGVPPSLNAWSRAHWRTRARLAKEWQDKIGKLWLVQGRPRLGLSEVLLEFTLPRGGDADNRCKFILDGLSGTFLEDDSPGSISELRIRARTGSPGAVRITITEIDAETGT